MLFVKTEDLKTGMRLAKPIFNKNGVLLYDRDTKLTKQGIISVENFGLIGLYVLEPAEPLPPLSDEDREFERFQTVSVCSLRDDLKLMIQNKKTKNLFGLCQSIIKNYGSLNNKINFIQNLRSPEDYIYKHSLNVAILSALISNQLKLDAQRQLDIVMAALIHDIGNLKLSSNLGNKSEGFESKELEQIRKSRTEAVSFIEDNNESTIEIKRLVMQIYRGIDAYYENAEIPRISTDAGIVLAAKIYDTLTAMKIDREPVSEIQAIRTLMSMSKAFPQKIIRGLIDSINILPQGLCVELTNKEKGLIISENKQDVQRPMVLGFKDNFIYDLSNDSIFKEIQIGDVMKTMDNRFVIDRKLLEEYQSKK